MSISQKINASTFFSPCDILQNNNFSSNQNFFNYLNNYSNIQQPLINIQSLNNFLFNFNNSININNITIKNILKEDEYSNLIINDKNEVNDKMNKVNSFFYDFIHHPKLLIKDISVGNLFLKHYDLFQISE